MRKGQTFNTGMYEVTFIGRDFPYTKLRVLYTGEWSGGTAVTLYVLDHLLPRKTKGWGDRLVETLLFSQGYDRYTNRSGLGSLFGR